MRPVVPGFNSCTIKLSESIDSLLKKGTLKCNSYIKDTNDFLNKLCNLKGLSSKSILVTMDVSSLYTNIDQTVGTETCFGTEKLQKHAIRHHQENDQINSGTKHFPI